MSALPKSERKPISTGSEWTFELVEAYDREIGAIADEYGLDTYANQIEIIRSEQMLDAYASVGMPIGYNHWSFGKHFVEAEQNYQRGYMGLAYEIVINSDPCIAYLMEENTMTMQALVIAHACYGHNSFFKGNYLFRTWTDATSIIDYLVFAKQYIARCEERHGVDAVEQVLDSCHALMNYGVDRYRRPYPVSPEEEKRMQRERGHPEAARRTAGRIQVSRLPAADRRLVERLLADLAGDTGDPVTQLFWLSQLYEDTKDDAARAEVDVEMDAIVRGMSSTQAKRSAKRCRGSKERIIPTSDSGLRSSVSSKRTVR